ncbi:MAG: hypothetical protein MJ131_08745 [Lachnospiraceae bacterium]|nr:hypothetical protein [Lachnospiraceae bacterium]
MCIGLDHITIDGKKTIHIRYILLSVIILLMSVFLMGCSLINTEKESIPNVRPYGVMINNRLYNDAWTTIEVPEDFKADGIIELFSDGFTPLINNQANNSSYIGCEYGFIDGKLYLLYKGKLQLFVESNYQPPLDEILDPQALNFNIADAEKNIEGPILCDFSSDEWKKYAYMRAENQLQNWYIETEAGDLGTEGKAFLYLTRKFEELFSNMLYCCGIGPTVLWGQKELSDYRFSFDFKLGAEDTISFAAFFQDMKTRRLINGKACFLTTWITFDEKGGLCRYCSHSMDTLVSMDDERMEDYYRCDDWNHIELYLEGTDLHMTLNGYELGTVFSFTDTPHGSAGIGSNGGSKFRNISIN